MTTIDFKLGTVLIRAQIARPSLSIQFFQSNLTMFDHDPLNAILNTFSKLKRW